jgi:mRNA-degrading endonuclease toxin of MazEF toxin-antitoxin module
VTIDGDVSKAVADQVRTLDRSRFLDRMGRMTEAELRAVEKAIRFQLDLG